jgi:hypothetical protein
LRLLQGAEESADIVKVGIAGEHRSDHERSVDDLPIAELFGE